jgi:REP element-mobilizing transposase RayT
MRTLRILKQGVWYEIRTRVNNREPLFRTHKAPVIFARVFRETELRFAFEIRGLRLEDDWLTFYIRPADGFQLPRIMQWMKQTFAARFNVWAGRTGHIWGDRYWSRVVAGEPPEWAEWAEWAEWVCWEAAETRTPAARRRPDRVSPRGEGKAAKTRFSPKIPLRSASPPRLTGKTRP